MDYKWLVSNNEANIWLGSTSFLIEKSHYKCSLCSNLVMIPG